jgi:prevent-host-death family protein
LGQLLDAGISKRIVKVMIVTEEVKAGQLAELLKQVQAGNEVVLTQDQKPVAKLISALPEKTPSAGTLQIRSFKGHKVLTPNISQADIAEDMFGQK